VFGQGTYFSDFKISRFLRRSPETGNRNLVLVLRRKESGGGGDRLRETETGYCPELIPPQVMSYAPAGRFRKRMTL
jgi:hypothetical protein